MSQATVWRPPSLFLRGRQIVPASTSSIHVPMPFKNFRHSVKLPHPGVHDVLTQGVATEDAWAPEWWSPPNREMYTALGSHCWAHKGSPVPEQRQLSKWPAHTPQSLVQATVNDQKLTEPTHSVAWTTRYTVPWYMWKDMVYYCENQGAKYVTKAIMPKSASLTQSMSIMHLKPKVSDSTQSTQ